MNFEWNNYDHRPMTKPAAFTRRSFERANEKRRRARP